jgi:CRP/FNR family transcriptional regulator/CRP/FNR family cyclic AMP-dependent transcriptional regulator
MTASAELLQRVPLLAALSNADREALAAALGRRRYRRGDIIFQKDEPGQSMFILERGSVRIYVPSAQGNDLILAVLGTGDFFGDLALLDGRPRSASAASIGDTILLSLERADFIALITSRPAAAMAVLEAVSLRLRDTDEMASDLAFLDVGGRLAKKLLELSATHGVQRPAGGTLVDLPITQEELANMIGVTRESVNRNLSNFRRMGLIQNQGRKLIIKDPERLRRRAE